MNIYCDESGFTGNNMSNEDQPHFSYVGINISEEYAAEKIINFTKKHNIRQEEIKGQSLLSKSNRYKEAVGELFIELLEKTKITVSLKKYSLACSFFEYIFEPLIAEKNSLFYESGFHQYIANTIYWNSYGNNKTANDMLLEFEKFMRNKENNVLSLFDKKSTVSFDISHIIEFASIHRDKIIEEFQGLGASQKWILDNSMTLLYHVLCEWTVDIGELTVVCDESKPLKAIADTFEAFVNRKDQFWREMNGKKYPSIPHLSKNISFENSKNNPGLQLADIMASTTTYILNHRNTCSYAQNWIDSLLPHISLAIVPDLEYFSISNADLWRNVLILEELIRRSRANKDLLYGIEKEFLLAQISAKGMALELASKDNEQKSSIQPAEIHSPAR